MLAYQPVYARRPFVLAQAPAEPVGASSRITPAYQDWRGVLIMAAVLAATGAGAYLGISTALETQNKTKKTLGWVAGLGAALAGVLYLSNKVGLTQGTGIPAVMIYPS